MNKASSVQKFTAYNKFSQQKDFGASERGQKPVQLGKGQPVSSRDQQGNPQVHVWEEDDVDSVKVHLPFEFVGFWQ